MTTDQNADESGSPWRLPQLLTGVLRLSDRQPGAHHQRVPRPRAPASMRRPSGDPLRLPEQVPSLQSRRPRRRDRHSIRELVGDRAVDEL